MNALFELWARISVVIFLVGGLGSLVVVVISFVEDIALLFELDDERDVDAATTRA